MRKYIIAALAFATILAGGLTFTACDDVDDVKDLTLDRLLSPTNVTAFIRNKTNVELKWDAINGATSYTIGVFQGNPNDGASALITESTEDVTYTITGLEGETEYTFGVKSVAEGKNDSKWSLITRSTDAEQIFYDVTDDDLQATSVTLRWPAGETATTIVITPGEITHSVTTDEITAGAATISGLVSETTYTAKLMNGEKTRGTVTFKTLIDFGDATVVQEGDNLVDILDNAAENAAIVLVSGTFDLGEYALTKSVNISGYKSSDKPTINGRFTVGATTISLSLTNLIVDGLYEQDNLLELKDANANVSNLNIIGCEIRNTNKHLIYANKIGKFGNITIDNCIIENVKDSEGDGIDLREGSELTSLVVNKSTFRNGFRTFLRCQVTNTATVSFNECTFYNVCTLDNSNNSGLFQMDKTTASSQLSVKKCFFYGVGIENPQNTASGVWAKKGKMKATCSYIQNYYYNCPNLWNTSNSQYADAHDDVAMETVDPQFIDAASGNLTIGNQTVKDLAVGDPRWY